MSNFLQSDLYSKSEIEQAEEMNKKIFSELCDYKEFMKRKIEIERKEIFNTNEKN